MIDDIEVLDSSTSTNRLNSSNSMPSNPFVGQIFLLLTPDGIFPRGTYVFNGSNWENATNSETITRINLGTGLIGGGVGVLGSVDLHIDTNYIATVDVTDQLDVSKLDRSGDSMHGTIVMNDNSIDQVAYPLEDHQAANKQYVDERALFEANKKVSKNGDEMFGPLTMNGNLVTGLPTPINPSDAVNKNYVDSIDLGVMNVYPANFGLNIVDVDGEVSIEVDYNVIATKQATDTLEASKVNRAGDTMSGVLAMGGNKIVNLDDPDADQDATTKVYVDQTIAANSVYSYPPTTTNSHGEFFVVLDSLRQNARNLQKNSINISGFNNDANYTSPNIDEAINYQPDSGDIMTVNGGNSPIVQYNTFGSTVSKNDNVVVSSPKDLLLSNVDQLQDVFGTSTTDDANVAVVSAGDVVIFSNRTSNQDVADTITITRTGIQLNNDIFWGSHNHGVGSGLHADILDGQHGSYYRNVGNMNAGTLSVQRGGLGVNTLTVNHVLVGDGINPVQLISRSGIDTRSSFPASAHTHDASDIASGVIAYGRLPFSSTQQNRWDAAYSWGDYRQFGIGISDGNAPVGIGNYQSTTQKSIGVYTTTGATNLPTISSTWADHIVVAAKSSTSTELRMHFGADGVAVHEITSGVVGASSYELWGTHNLSPADTRYHTTFEQDVTVQGNLFVAGDTIQVDSSIETAGRIITLNDGEQGAGVTGGFSGVEVDRGSLIDYQFGFNEETGVFELGEIGDRQAVATRELAPTSNGFAIWNNNTSRFDTITTSTVGRNLVNLDTPASNSWLQVNSDGSLTTRTHLESFRSTTSDTVAVREEVIFVNTTSNPVSITLPASPQLGDQVTVIDLAGTFATNNCTIIRNGSNIMSLSENMTISSNNASVTMIYSGNSTHGWRIRY